MAKILYVFNEGQFRKYTDVVIFPDRYISYNGNEPIPFEDVGDCLLTEDDITVDEAFEQWEGR